MKKVLQFLFCLCLLVGCSGQDATVGPTPVPAPTASFTLSGGEYGEYDFTSSTTNATIYTWDFGDGATSPSPSTSHKYDANGQYTIKLTAKGEGGTITTTQTLNVTDVRASLTVWAKTDNKFNAIIEVILDGQKISTIDRYFDTAPPCNRTGTAIFALLKEGGHTYSARQIYNNQVTRIWIGTIMITGGQCILKELTY